MNKKQHKMSPRQFFVLVAQLTKTDKLLKFFNFCVFLQIWMKFGIGANIGQKITQNVFETATAIFSPADCPHIPSRTITLFFFLLCIDLRVLINVFFPIYSLSRYTKLDQMAEKNYRTVPGGGGRRIEHHLLLEELRLLFQKVDVHFIWDKESAVYVDALGNAEVMASSALKFKVRR